jgi:uncharacterized protein (TIGR00299 family) protein
MRLLHFDCFSGISGDMVLGALVDAGLPLKDLARQLKSLPAGGYVLRAGTVTRQGLRATKVDVLVKNGFHRPLSLEAIHRIIRTSRLPAAVKERSRDVFARLARAEGIAHRVRAARVQFHEVGVVDSLVDVVGGILGCHLLGVERITASPVNLGSGFIDSAHGRLPAPGPAVTALARGLPIYSAGPERELTTPTGLALLAALADEFGGLPLMRPEAIGYGAGTADTSGWPNVLRVFLGEPVSRSQGETDSVVQVETNLDDLNPQAYDTVMARLFEAGAVDVTLTPVIMKQGRPGIVLTALAPPGSAESVAGVMLRETTTLGVRMQEIGRRMLPRRVERVRIRDGTVRMKVAGTARGTRKAAPEYRDCRAIAERTGRPVREIMEEAMLAFRQPGRQTRRRT